MKKQHRGISNAVLYFFVYILKPVKNLYAA